MSDSGASAAFPTRPPEQETVGAADAGAVRHWLGFYRELIDFEERALGWMTDLAEGLTPEARDRVEASNLEPIRTELRVLRGRQEAWRRRGEELEPRRSPRSTARRRD